MRSRYVVVDSSQAYFITSTIVEWLPVFTSKACCDILVNALLHCRETKALKIYAWVILDNHFHAIVQGPNLSATLRALKGFTAQALIEQIRKENREWLLNQLAFYCKAHKRASEHQVWQEGIHAQEISDDDKMMHQKLDYIHNNPVERGYVAAAEHWRYSSAHEWLVGAHPLFKCDLWC